MRHNHVSIGQRILAMALAVVMVFGMATPATATSLEDAFVGGFIIDQPLVGAPAGGGESQTVKVDEETMVATLSSNTLVETTVNGQTGWWLDLDIEVQTDTYSTDLVLYWAKYEIVVSYGDSADTETGKFADKCADGDVVGHFDTKLPDVETIKQLAYDGEMLKVEWKFDWNGDETYDQVITLDVDPSTLVLKTAQGFTVYPVPAFEYGTVSELTSGLKIEAEDPADITVSNHDVVLDWVAADPSIGRNVDGWWIGFRIDAPQMEEALLEKVHYKSGDAVRNFWMSKDSAAGADVHYMTMWVCVNDVLFEGEMDPYVYAFDWNLDGVYEQKVTLDVSELGDGLKLKQDNYDITGETVALYVYTNGNGSVKLNGETVSGQLTLIKNLAYNLELVPGDENTSVESVKYNWNEISVDQIPVRFSNIWGGLEVTFVTKYKVSVPEQLPEGCTVVLKDADNKVNTTGEYKMGDTAYCTVTAADGYRIKEVKFGDEVISLDGDGKTFTFNKTVTANTAISVTFVQVYEVNVEIDGNGQVWINDKAASGSITVEQDPNSDKLILKAQPDEHHRVSEVVVNDTKLEVSGENDQPFETALDYGAYQIKVTFAPNVYTLRVEGTGLEHVAVSGLPEGQVAYGTKLNLTLTPDEGYMITDVTAEGSDLELGAMNTTAVVTVMGDTVLVINAKIKEYKVAAAENELAEIKLFKGDTELTDDEKVSHGEKIRVQVQPVEGYQVKTLQIKDKNNAIKQTVDVVNGTAEITVEMDMTIHANAEKIKDVKLSDVQLRLSADGLVRQDGGLHVYRRDTVVKITASTVENEIDQSAKFRIGFSNNNTNNVIYQEHIASSEGQLVLNTANADGTFSNREVDGVAYVLQYLGEDGWANVVDANNNPIRIMFDTDLPTISDVKLSAVAEGAVEGYYAADLTFGLNASDLTENQIDYTGIASVEYVLSEKALSSDDLGSVEWVAAGVVASGSEAEADGAIAVEGNNGKHLYLSLRVTDAAGNVYTELNSKEFFVDTEDPTAKVSASGEKKPNAVDGFLSVADRTVTIELNEWTESFDEEKAVLSLKKDGKTANVAVEWSVVDGKPVATFQVAEEGVYEWSVAYTSRTGAKLDITGEGQEYKFTIDRTDPKGKELKVDKDAAPDFMDKLLEKITFGFFKNNKTTYTTEWTDATEIIEKTYLKTDLNIFADVKDMAELVAKLDAKYEAGEFSAENEWGVEDGDAVIFARAVDAAGNVGYTSTEGVIFDSKKPVITVEITEVQNEGAGQHGADEVILLKNDGKASFGTSFNVHIEVTDNILENIAGSGVKEVRYKVSHPDYYWGVAYEKIDNQNVISAEFDQENHVGVTEIQDFVVKAQNNGFVEYTLTVTAVDFAGNVAEEYVSKVEVNVEPPKAEIVMDEGKERPVWATGNYYNYNRTATITITDHERSWNPDGVVLGENIDPSWISAWVSAGDKHTATITFPEADGHYEWSIEYTNKHGRSLAEKTEKSENTFDFYQDYDFDGAINVSNDAFWGDLLEKITFGLFKNEELTFEISVEKAAPAEDNIVSGTNTYAYRYTGTDMNLGEGALKSMLENQLKHGKDKPFELVKDGKVTVNSDQDSVLYFFVTDYAGNFTCAASTGIVVESDKPEVEVTADKTRINAADEVVTLTIKASDVQRGKHDSGIKSVSYWVLDPNGNVLIEERIVEEFKNTDPVYDELWHERDWTVELKEDDLNKINFTNAKVVVKAVDNAGNENQDELLLDVDRTCPVVTVKFDEDAGNKGYYNYNRTATITFVERGQHFAWNDEAINDNDACGAVMGNLVAKDAKGNVIDLRFGNGGQNEDQYDVIIQSKETQGGNLANGDEDTHKMVILFCGDANYDLSALSFIDKAGNPAEVKFEGKNANKFTVDKTDPTGSLTAVPDGRSDLAGSWTEQVGEDRSEMPFELWASKNMSVSATTDDVTSPIAKVEYYVCTTSTRSLSEAELVDANWKTTEKLAPVYVQDKEDAQFAVYLRITDMANNMAYLRTDGLIRDEELPNLGETKAPAITVVAPYEGQIHKGDVTMDIIVKETGIVNSGLKSISYEVFNDDISTTKPTQSGELWTFRIEDPKNTDLQTKVEEKLTVIAKSADGEIDNNSNNVRVVITAVDNAGNEEQKTINLMIDVTKPEIAVSYNNNSGIKHGDGRTYFDKTRVATVEVTERNFNKNLVEMAIGAAHGSKVTISDWSKKVGTKANGDDTTWTATVTYSADDDYTFGISCTDNAKNANEPVTYTGTAPTAFTVDQTKPVVSVSYDNNTDNNGNGYFNAYRTATITVLEHNFDKDLVDITLGATLDGSPIAKPTVSDWSKSGDRWTATVSFHADGDYTFDVTAKDKAGNVSGPASYGNSVAPKAFTVDTTLVEPAITGVETGKAYPAELIPAVSFTDVNFADYELKLLRTNLGVIDEDISKEMTDLIQRTEQTITGVFDIFQIVADDPGAKDGIYELSLRVWDDAGNESIQELVFSVNRNGSVYVFGEYLVELLEQGHVTAVDGELTVTEYNADRLVADSLLVRVTHNGRALADVALAPEPVINDEVAVGEMGWYEYVYTLSKDYFTEDGIYQITYSSKDAAGNTSDNSEIRFVVDSEKPELSSVIGMEEPIVNAPRLDVQFNAFDSIGLKSITILVDGQVVETITDFGDDINSYSGVFTLEESKRTQNVQIIVEDMAGNILDTDAEDFAPVYEFNKEITVSTNFFVRWYANTVLFWSSIAAMGLLAYLLWFFLIFKRKKKDEEENGEQK